MVCQEVARFEAMLLFVQSAMSTLFRLKIFSIFHEIAKQQQLRTF